MSANLRRTKPSPSSSPHLPSSHRWSCLDSIPSFPSSPSALLSAIDAAISSTELSRSSSPPPPSPSPSPSSSQEGNGNYDAGVAEEAYKAACAALSAGRPEAAVKALGVAMETCPPEKTTAVGKLRSLMAIASAQAEKRKEKQKRPAFA